MSAINHAWVGRAVLQIIEHNTAKGIFEPEDLRVLTAAFDEAWKRLEKSGVRFETDYQRHQVRNTLGKCIIEQAKGGERDKGRLRDSALLLYCQSILRKPPHPLSDDPAKDLGIVQ